MKGETYRTIEMHTAGEPVRIVVDGYPELPGASLLEKRRYASQHLDHIRKRLMLEPRGHAEMYGVIPTRPSHPAADLAVLFTTIPATVPCAATRRSPSGAGRS